MFTHRLLGVAAALVGLSTFADAAEPDAFGDAVNISERPIAGYVPGTGINVVCTLFFLTVTVLLWYQYWRRSMRCMLVLNIGSTCMTIGFILRLVYAKASTDIGRYIIQYMLILLSPCAFIAMDYILLPRLAVHVAAEDCLFIRPERVAKIFIWSDVSTFLIQCAGGGMSAAAGDIASVGEKISIVGIVIQLVSFGLFTVLLLNFGWRVKQRYPRVWHTTALSGVIASKPFDFFSRKPALQTWKVLYFALAYTCIGILIRSVFRTIELCQGYSGYLATHEGYLIGLDTFPLWLAITAFVFVWPPRWFTPDSKIPSGHASVYESVQVMGSSSSSGGPKLEMV